MSGNRRKISEEHKVKISNALKGSIPWNKGVKGVKLPPRTKEHSEKIRLALLGRKIKGRKGHKAWNKGLTSETDPRVAQYATKHGLTNRAEKHWNWQGGKTKTGLAIRTSTEYKLWRKSVFERDNYTCVWCLQKDEVAGKLNADHIKPFAYYPELRFAIDNGRTLCVDCHKTTDTYGGKCRKNLC